MTISIQLIGDAGDVVDSAEVLFGPEESHDALEIWQEMKDGITEIGDLAESGDDGSSEDDLDEPQ